MITGLHHVGMAVDDLDATISFYETIGFRVLDKSEYPSINATRAMIQKDGARLELFQFADLQTEAAQKIKKHTAFSSDDLENDLQKFLDEGYELAIPIDKGSVVKRYAYVKDIAGNFIELCEPLDA